MQTKAQFPFAVKSFVTLGEDLDARTRAPPMSKKIISFCEEFYWAAGLFHIISLLV